MKKLSVSPMKKSENLKIKCPFCKEKIPSNATRCSHCTAGLSGKEAQDNIEKQLKQTKRNIIAGLSFFGFLIFLIVIVTVTSPSSNTPNSPTLNVGDYGVLQGSQNPEGSNFIATDLASYDEMWKAIRAGDVVGEFELVAQGKMFGVTNGTGVLIIDSKIGKRRVRILSAARPIDEDKIGRTGWIPEGWVVSK